MTFERVVFGHATHQDGELAHVAAAILHRHGVKCTVADGGNLKDAIAECQSEKAGWGDFVVIGGAAKDMFPDKLKPYIGETVKRSDYRDAVGRDVEESARKLARVLDGIATRKHVEGDLRRDFEDALGLVGTETHASRDHGRPSDGNGRGGEKNPEAGGGRRTEQESAVSNGTTKQREAADEGSAKPKTGGLTEEELEEIGREALELLVRKLAVKGGP
jgi:hypothetical protein